MQGLQLTGYGDPADVVKLVDLPDVGAPGPDEIVIDIEASPVEPTDLYIVAGVYGSLPTSTAPAWRAGSWPGLDRWSKREVS